MHHRYLWASVPLSLALFAYVFVQTSSDNSVETAQNSELADSHHIESQHSAQSGSILRDTKPETNSSEPVTNPIPSIALSSRDMSSHDMSSQLESALQSYAEFSRYPPTSQPIVSDNHLHSFVNTSTPINEQTFNLGTSDKAITATLALADYQHQRGDVISGSIELSNVVETSSLSAEIKLEDLEGNALANFDLPEFNEQALQRQLAFELDSALFDTDDWPIEINLAMHLSIDGEQVYLSSPMRMNPLSAEVIGVGTSFVNEEYLEIPVEIMATLPGYYHLSAVLSQPENARPMVHLEAEGKLSQGTDTLTLKAHIQALKKAGEEGPYILNHIRLERWSDEEIPLDIAGTSTQTLYPVDGFSFDAYLDKPYLDPLAEERIKLLQGLGSL